MKSIRKEKFSAHPYLCDIHSNVQKINSEIFKCPFLLPVKSFFQTKNRTFYLMEILKQTLFDKFEEERRFTESKVKFYVAQMAYAIGELHKENLSCPLIIPENILLDEKHYAYLNYIGKTYNLSYSNESDYNFFGLPCSYMAPEILNKEELSLDIDWWSLGIFMYELLVGTPPFNADSVNFMRQLVNESELQFPRNLSISDDAKDLISRLLTKSKSERLGHVHDLSEVKMHPWFNNLNWEGLAAKTEDYLWERLSESVVDSGYAKSAALTCDQTMSIDFKIRHVGGEKKRDVPFRFFGNSCRVIRLRS